MMQPPPFCVLKSHNARLKPACGPVWICQKISNRKKEVLVVMGMNVAFSRSKQVIRKSLLCLLEISRKTSYLLTGIPINLFAIVCKPKLNIYQLTFSVKRILTDAGAIAFIVGKEDLSGYASIR
jgi:hypothetical protein